MKTRFVALMLAAAAVLPAQAKEPKVLDPTMVPTADATLKGLAAVIADSKAQQAQLGGRAAQLEKQIAAIKAKAKNPKVDVAEQLPKEDLDALNLLGAQLRYLQGAETVEAIRQRNLTIAKDVYRASFFTATMMSEYIGEKGAIDDDFDDYCRAKAKTYGLQVPVDILFSLQDYIIDSNPGKK